MSAHTLALAGFQPLVVLDAETGWVASYPLDATPESWGVTREHKDVDAEGRPVWALCNGYDGDCDTDFSPAPLRVALAEARRRNGVA